MRSSVKTEHPPIPVVDVTETREDAADFGAYNTTSVPTTAANAVPVTLLNRRINRHRAVISMIDAPLTQGDVLVIGSNYEAVQAHQGYTMTVQNQTLVIENQQALYALVISATAGNAIRVSVLDESWDNSEPTSEDPHAVE